MFLLAFDLANSAASQAGDSSNNNAIKIDNCEAGHQSENQGTVMTSSGTYFEQRMRAFIGNPKKSALAVLVLVLLPLLVNLPALLGRFEC
jgi:hypothetical protein